MIKFCSKRGIYFGISALILVAGIIALFVNGIELDKQFKGGAVIKYEYTGEISDGAFLDAAVEAVGGRNASCQITTDTATGVSTLVLTFAGDESLTQEELSALDEKLSSTFPNSGLNVVEQRLVTPSLGARFLNDCIKAIVIAFVLIMLYMWYAFRKIGGLLAGAVALIALVYDTIIVFLIFVFFKIPINENFVTAVLTIIGFSVNDTIVIFDRIRENHNLYGSKLTMDELVDKSVTQSMSRTINTSVAVFISIFLVFIFAQINNLNTITSFALPMSFGVISGCYSSTFLAGPLWAMWKGGSKRLANGKLVKKQ